MPSRSSAGKIAWVGRMDEGRRDWEGPRTRVVDARGGLITAGFDDAHIHVLSGAEDLDRVDLFQLPTVEAIQAAIAAPCGGEPGRRLGPGSRLDVRPVPGRPADPRPARRGRAGPAGVHGLLRRPHGLGQHRGPPRRRHRSRHPRPVGRRDRPRRRDRRGRPASSRRAPRNSWNGVIPRPTDGRSPRRDPSLDPGDASDGHHRDPGRGGGPRRGRALADAPR